MTLKGSWTTPYDYATDTETNMGPVYQQTYPGFGLLFHDVGLVSFGPGGVVVYGPHDVLEQGDAAFYNALEAIG